MTFSRGTDIWLQSGPGYSSPALCDHIYRQSPDISLRDRDAPDIRLSGYLAGYRTLQIDRYPTRYPANLLIVT
jgi:hypothetical protein